MYTLAQLAGKVAQNCILATIQSRHNISAISLHRLSLLKVGRQDSSGNLQALLSSVLFWTGFYEVVPGLNPTVYDNSMFEVVQIKTDPQFMALKQAVIRSNMRVTFSYFESTRFLVLTSRESVRAHLPELLIQLEAPEESIRPVVEVALQKIAT